VALLVDSFALGLVALAALLLAGTFELPAFETIRRITFGVIGIALVAFLIGRFLTHARSDFSPAMGCCSPFDGPGPRLPSILGAGRRFPLPAALAPNKGALPFQARRRYGW
jgi:hypothetical protein